MNIQNWIACVQDRGKWKEFVEKAKTINQEVQRLNDEEEEKEEQEQEEQEEEEEVEEEEKEEGEDEEEEEKKKKKKKITAILEHKITQFQHNTR